MARVFFVGRYCSVWFLLLPCSPMADLTKDILALPSVIRKDVRCKVCMLSESHVDWFLEIHKQVILEGIQATQAAAWLNNQISEWNKVTDDPDKQMSITSTNSVITHFNRHVPAQYAIQAKLSVELSQNDGMRTLFPPAVDNAIRSMEGAAARANVDDFKRLTNIVDRVERRVMEFDDSLASDGIKLDNAQAYQALMTMIVKMLETTIKLRNQDKMIRAALVSCLDSFTMGSLQEMMLAIERLFHEYRGQFKDPAAADMLAHKLREAVGKAMTNGARTALDHVRDMVKSA